MARRIVAVLIVLLLLVLLVPWAFRALTGPGEESSIQAPPETTGAGIASNGGEETTAEETTVEEVTVGITEEATIAGREETDSSTGDVEALGDQGASPDIEAAVDLTGVGTDLGGGDTIGEANTSQSAPVVPAIDTGIQRLAQPISFKQAVQPPTPKPAAEPITPKPSVPESTVEPTVPEPAVEPIAPEPPALSEEPVSYQEPLYFEEPATFYEEPVSYQEPLYSEEPATFYEEPAVPEVTSVPTVTATVGGTMAAAGGGVAVASAGGHR